ncbi:MAG: Ig-like domain-containing protein [Angelakisella sp.]
MKLFKRTILPLFMILALLLSNISAYALTTEDWYKVKGIYGKDDNSQYNSGVLSLMYLDNDVVMFEFFMMEGSEQENSSNNFRLAGAFYLDDKGTGIYDDPKTGDVKITFDLTEGGVSVKQTGKLPIDVSGEYGFLDNHIEVTEEAAKEILEQLPTAATSLNHNNGEYKLSKSEETVDGWFYDIKANFVDTKALLAEFYVAKDMSAVYRVDTDTPILIWGTAQPMLDATYLAEGESFFGTTTDELNADAKDATSNYVDVPYVSIAPKDDAIPIGATTQIVVTVPGKLTYTLQCRSSNAEIAKVDENGVITGVADGEAVISGVVTIDGAEKSFEFTVSPFDAKAVLSGSSQSANSTAIWVVLVTVVAVPFVVSAVMIKKKKPGAKPQD